MGNILTILTSIAFGAAGQILLKMGVNKLGSIQLSMNGLLSILKNLYIWIGLVLFGASFLLWLKILSKNDLSYVYPMVSLNYVIIIVASRFLFNEPLTANKVIGTVIIVAGVFLINR